MYILRISSSRSTKLCDNLGSKNFNFPSYLWNFDFFEATGKSKIFESKLRHNFVDPHEWDKSDNTWLRTKKLVFT